MYAPPTYKPFKYPWAFDAWIKQQQMHWLPEEVPMTEDIQDWKHNLTANEKHLLTQIFRFFTQADVEVGGCYMDHYIHRFKPIEVKMMLMAFANMETVHMHAYSYLMNTVGMEDGEYSAFLQYKEMKDKYDYMKRFNSDSHEDLAKTLGVFSAFVEGLQLFASFAMLMHFPRVNKMKGMGQIIAWSVRDESWHVENMITLYHAFKAENIKIASASFDNDLMQIAEEMVQHEFAFIDLAFKSGEIRGMSGCDIKEYIKYIANRRLNQLKLTPMYDMSQDAQNNYINPLPWLDDILNAVEHTNFFENRATDYSRAATTGDWDKVFEEEFETTS